MYMRKFKHKDTTFPLPSRVYEQDGSIVCSTAIIFFDIQVCFWESNQKDIKGPSLFYTQGKIQI